PRHLCVGWGGQAPGKVGNLSEPHSGVATYLGPRRQQNSFGKRRAGSGYPLAFILVKCCLSHLMHDSYWSNERVQLWQWSAYPDTFCGRNTTTEGLLELVILSSALRSVFLFGLRKNNSESRRMQRRRSPSRSTGSSTHPACPHRHRHRISSHRPRRL